MADRFSMGNSTRPTHSWVCLFSWDQLFWWGGAPCRWVAWYASLVRVMNWASLQESGLWDGGADIAGLTFALFGKVRQPRWDAGDQVRGVALFLKGARVLHLERC